MENEEQMELKSFTDNGKSYQYIPSKQDQNYYEGSIRNNR